MPALNSETLILALAVLLVLAGMVGLAPSLSQVVRRRRLVSQLANLKVDEDEKDALFSPSLAGIRTSHDVATAPPEHLPRVVQLSQIPKVTPPTASEAAQAEVPRLPTVADSPAAVETEDEKEEPSVEASLQDEIESDADADVEDASDESPSGDEDAEDEDDLLAMFRDTKVASAMPAALEEAFEQITAADLLAQARDLRDLLRRAA